jgi:hypothetical protein
MSTDHRASAVYLQAARTGTISLQSVSNPTPHPRLATDAYGANDAEASIRALRRWAVALLLACVLSLTIIDLLLQRVNLSILYLVAMAVLARLLPRSGMFAMALLLIAVTYLGYFVDVRASLLAGAWGDVVNFRLLNRTLVAGCLLLTGILLHRAQRLRSAERILQPLERDEENRLLFSTVSLSFEQLSSRIVSVLIVILLALGDMLTPGELNFPVLYIVPLVLLAIAGDGALVMLLAPALVLLTFTGFFYGAPVIEQQFVFKVATNRTIAASAIVLFSTAVFFFGQGPTEEVTIRRGI